MTPTGSATTINGLGPERSSQVLKPLSARLEAVEGMADVARRFQEMRAQGKFKRATDKNDLDESGAASERIGKE